MVYFEAMESEMRLKNLGETLNRALQKRDEVRVVYLFGSRARGLFLILVILISGSF